LRTVVADIAPGVPIYELSTMQQKISGTLEHSHFYTFLLGFFAATALLLSSVGIYGVLSYTVAQRTREVGIRLALGAQKSELTRMFLQRGLLLACIGVAIGLGAAALLTRLMSSLLFDISPLDPLTYVAMPFVLLIALASYMPARRASRVDPLIAIRHE
jgi:ABC-type antimicrobial peptide transport system permease subunit